MRKKQVGEENVDREKEELAEIVNQVVPDQSLSDKTIAAGMKLSILVSRASLERRINELEKRVMELQAENEALRMELSKILAERDEYKRLLKFESSMSNELMVRYLILLDKYKALSTFSMAEGMRFADVAAKYAHALRYGIAMEDINDQLIDKVKKRASLDDIESTLEVLKKVDKVLGEKREVILQTPVVKTGEGEKK